MITISGASGVRKTDANSFFRPALSAEHGLDAFNQEKVGMAPLFREIYSASLPDRNASRPDLQSTGSRKIHTWIHINAKIPGAAGHAAALNPDPSAVRNDRKIAIYAAGRPDLDVSALAADDDRRPGQVQ